jgi:ribose transport system ATP-binding protein
MNHNQSSAFSLKMGRITKHFGATCALDQVDFDLGKGEVHALLGENGAGKSTLVKIISGAIQPDQGEMHLDGRPYHPSDPLDGRRSGVSMIYQELNLAPHLTVEENIMLGKEVHQAGFLRRREVRKKVKEALDFLHHPEIALDVPIRQLSVGARQIVEISRAIIDRAKILVMDEPTSSLTQEDTDRLFEVIRKLRDEGVSIIYISHFLEEVQAVADRYTVLRDGKNVGSGNMAKVTLDDLIQLMVGQKIRDLFVRVEHQCGEALLSLRGLKGKTMQEPLSFELHRGEILGLAGLIGAGRTETLRTIFGLDALGKGSVEISGKKSIKARPWSRIAQGMGLLSEDRQGEGLALSRSVTDNVTLSHFAPYRRFGFLSVNKRSKAVAGWIDSLKIKAQNPGQLVLSLSGGNQQKVALARLLHQEADILLLDEPTRGIDVMSKSQIYEWISQLAAQGKAVLFVSSYFPELLGVCDTIAVFYRGQLVDIRPARDWSDERLMAASTTGRA